MMHLAGSFMTKVMSSIFPSTLRIDIGAGNRAAVSDPRADAVTACARRLIPGRDTARLTGRFRPHQDCLRRRRSPSGPMSHYPSTVGRGRPAITDLTGDSSPSSSTRTRSGASPLWIPQRTAWLRDVTPIVR